MVAGKALGSDALLRQSALRYASLCLFNLDAHTWSPIFIFLLDWRALQTYLESASHPIGVLLCRIVFFLHGAIRLLKHLGV